MPEVVAVNVTPVSPGLGAFGGAAQYQVCPADGVPERVNVTPTFAHCGELLVGLPGSAGRAFTITDKLPVPAPELQQRLLLFLERI